MNPVIRLSQVTKRYRRTTALDDVSFEVPPGVVFAMLGENGAGKSTAIRILLGLSNANAGSAQVLGLDWHKDGLAIRRRVGYVAEEPTLYDWMTVTEIGWFTAGFYTDGFLTRYMELTERFELPPDRKIKALSKGMRAKVSLSLAMAHDPDLLVLDEPTSGLDAMVRRQFLESMVDLAATGRTVLLSSHQIDEVERVADIVAMIREGKLLLVESLDKLKSETTQWIITLTDGDGPLPTIEGEILSQRRRGRQWQLLVRGDEQQQSDQLHQHPRISAIESRRPGLEDLFIAYMQRDRSSSETSAEEAPTPKREATSS